MVERRKEGMAKLKTSKTSKTPKATKTCETCYYRGDCRHSLKKDGSWSSPCIIYINLKEYFEEHHIPKTCETCSWMFECVSCIKRDGSGTYNSPCNRYWNRHEARKIESGYTAEQKARRIQFANELTEDLKKEYQL